MARKRKKATFIKSVPQLRLCLQQAIELEHATIPPYLCALYSIVDGKNEEAAAVIRSVVMEEMLHLTLAANVLNAIGGNPSINGPDFVPDYPTALPVISRYSKPFTIGLRKFSHRAISTFLKIEQPERMDKANPRKPDTIGEFYLAIENALYNFSHEPGGQRKLFSGSPDRQVQPDTFYYGGGGKVVVVNNFDSAKAALDEIVEQGEGFHHSIYDGDKRTFGEDEEVAHYYRFNEIHKRQYYKEGDTPDSHPSGERFQVNYRKSAVYNMRPNPKTEDYERGSELWRKSAEFSKCYMELLGVLHEAFNGDQDRLVNAVGQMYELKDRAVALMKIPYPGATGDQTAGPTFEYWPVEV